MQKIQLSIPEPCHQNWNEMTPTQQGRFCNSCAKQVIDFSNMSDTQVLNYFSNIKNENVCGRAYPDQLERAITIPKEPNKKLFWYWNYITMLFLFFSKTNTAKAQGGMKVVVESKVDTKQSLHVKNMSERLAPKINGIQASLYNDTGTIDKRVIRIGTVRTYSESNEVLLVVDGIIQPLKRIEKLNPNDIKAVKILKNAEAMALYGSAAYSGVILVTTKTKDSLPEYKKLDTVVVNSYMHFKRKELINCTATVMGSMVSGVTVKTTFTDTIKSITTKITGAIKIFPNPIQRGNSFTLSLKLKQAGIYNIQIVDAAGRIVVQKQTIATAKAHTEQMQTKSIWSSGIYYVRIFNDKNNFISTHSFSLQ